MTRRTNGFINRGTDWGVLIAAVALGFVLVGAFWTIVQTEFTAQGALIQDNRTAIDKAATLLQAQLDRRFGEVDRRLGIIETTRPTVGELQAISKGVEDRMRSLEQQRK
jgi:hypothetical protein